MNRCYFFLNPYSDAAFTRCPKCEGKTKVKKLPLTIVTEKNKAILNVNKTCKYCPYCELLIAKKSEMDIILKQIFFKDILEFTMQQAGWCPQ